MRIATINFNSGEFTPKIDARSDTEKYAGGCRRLENMIPSVFGSAERRPGTEFISNTAVLGTMITNIIAYENVGVCYEDDVISEAYSTFLEQIVCHENDIVCHENNMVFATSLVSQALIVVCYENNVVFYENELVIYE